MNSHGYGMAEPRPLRGFPEGKTRIRIRNTHFPVVYVRPPEGGVIAFLVDDDGEVWTPGRRTGSNVMAEALRNDTKQGAGDE